MSEEHYLSAAFFERLEDMLRPPRTPAKPHLVVQHAPLGGSAHHQVFNEAGLVRWTPGIAEQAMIEVRWPVEHEKAVLLRTGRIPDGVSPRIVLSSGETDLLGVDLLCAPRYAKTAPLTIVDIAISDGAFGPLRTRITFESGTITRSDTADDSHISITCRFEDAVRWLHGDTLLGHLMTDGAVVEGDLFRLSAVEGIVSASECQQARRAFGDAVIAWERGLSSASYAEVARTLASTDSPS